MIVGKCLVLLQIEGMQTGVEEVISSIQEELSRDRARHSELSAGRDGNVKDNVRIRPTLVFRSKKTCTHLSFGD